MNNKRKKNTAVLAVLGAAVIVIILILFSFSNLYKHIEYAAVDLKWHKFYDSAKSDTNIVIIAIDNKSIDYFSSDKYMINWPWPREFYAFVLDYLNAAGAKSVMFDMLFSQSEIARLEVDSESSNKNFGNSIANNGEVILGANAIDSTTNFKKSNYDKYTLNFENSELFPAEEYPSISLPMPILTEGVASIGATGFTYDNDGVCRRAPLIVRIGDKLFPQLAFAAYLYTAKDSVLKYDENKNVLITKKSKIPLDKDGNYRIYWYGPGGESKLGTYRYDSFHAVFLSAIQYKQGMKPQIPFSEYKNKNILICASASGLLDLKVTPFTSIAPFPGGEIHTTLFDNLLNHNRLRSASDMLIYSLTFFLLILISYLFLTKELKYSLSAAISSIIVVISVNFLIFAKFSINFDFVFPVLGLILISASSSMYKMLTEGKARKQIKTIFSRYLDKGVIDLLMKDPDKIDLAGSEVTGTVLFTDLQGFTTYSEKKNPKKVIETLNKYFHIITSIVLKNGGMLDKYTGDGIMAIFGAPIERKDHAKAACEVILSFREQKVNELIPSEKSMIKTRIGINSGEMVVGNLGSEKRMDYTAIGDTVNLSARLEGVNKSYGITNMISESTWKYVQDDYYFREVDLIRVKGKHLPIKIFTLVDRIENMTKEKIEIENRFNNALNVYRTRDWKKAIKAFENVLEISEDDTPSKAFIDRCAFLKKTPELVDEQGVFTFKTK
ncbi:MAG: adenylate/guanylate cyclase domain-containing protein [Candidatus Marinimicrobia bacterium]|nr:adenylate/guanylate cyclase domain-containing protein [Candidatus Neomarinimicrobiota bacterium]